MKYFLGTLIENPHAVFDECNSLAHSIYLPEINSLIDDWQLYNTAHMPQGNSGFAYGRDTVYLSGSTFNVRRISDPEGVMLMTATKEFFHEAEKVHKLFISAFSSFNDGEAYEVLGVRPDWPTPQESDVTNPVTAKRFMFTNRVEFAALQTMKTRLLLKDLDVPATFSSPKYGKADTVEELQGGYKSLFKK